MNAMNDNPWRPWARDLVAKHGRTVAYRALLCGEHELALMTRRPRVDVDALRAELVALDRTLALAARVESQQ